MTVIRLQIGIFNYDEVISFSFFLSSLIVFFLLLRVLSCCEKTIKSRLYNQVLSGNMLLGGFLFGSCVIFMTFVLLNLLLSVILVAFNMELEHHQVLTIPFREVSSCFLSYSPAVIVLSH